MNTPHRHHPSAVAALLSAALVCLASCTGSDGSGTAESTPAAQSTTGASTAPAPGPGTSTGQDAATGCAVNPANPAPSDTAAVRRAAAATLAVGVTGYDAAAAAVDNGVRHLFIGSSTDRSLLDGQGDPARSLASLRQRVEELDGPDGPGLTVSVDEEGGRVQRLADLTGTLPSARDMAATMTPEQVTALFTDHARKLRDLGITMDFAPDTDLGSATGSAADAIGDRAFSTDPQVVVTYGRAVVDGLLAGGVTPVIKHFPGHGHATGDSHTGAVTTPPLDRMGPDLQPFRELSQIPGVAVMVGHMQVPGLDSGLDSGQGAGQTPGGGETAVTGADTPASLNPAAYALLREGDAGAPGFTGVVFTDDLTGMQAVTDRYSAGEAVVGALRAGADAPLVSSGVDAAQVPGILDSVVSAVSGGTLGADVLAAAADRICASTVPGRR